MEGNLFVSIASGTSAAVALGFFFSLVDATGISLA